jgi:very-short-patch-repair endonuclease
MYLFHSLDPMILGQNDLRARLIQHFVNPRTASMAAGREACESPFEEEVFDYLVGQGFRVLTQVPAVGKRIDLVVEDSAGRRLALECDGYVAHPPHRWLEDLGRQRILERAGWVFHRIWGPSFYRDKEGCLAELLSALESHGVCPDGGDGTSCLHVVEHREVGPAESQQDAESEEVESFLEDLDASDVSTITTETLPESDSIHGHDPDGLNAALLPDEESGSEGNSLSSDAAAATSEDAPNLAPINQMPEVKVGRTVEIEFLDDPAANMRFTITEGPTIMEEGLINYGSPLNTAILDHRQGEVVEAQIAGVTRSIRIAKVEID